MMYKTRLLIAYVIGQITISVGVFIIFFLKVDLAVHKKKISEVEQWLEFAFSPVSLMIVLSRWLQSFRLSVYVHDVFGMHIVHSTYTLLMHCA